MLQIWFRYLGRSVILRKFPVFSLFYREIQQRLVRSGLRPPPVRQPKQNERRLPAEALAKEGWLRKRYMFYVHLIQIQDFPEQRYVGFTTDLKKRIAVHNTGGSVHTSKYKPLN